MRTRYVTLGVLSLLAIGVGACDRCECGNCPLPIGKVDDVSLSATLDGSEASQNDDIYPGNIIETDEEGVMLFHTDDVARCDTRGNSHLEIRPDDRLAIKWSGNSGVSYCNKKSGQGKEEFGINGKIEIFLDDPVFGVILGENEAVVRLIDGPGTVTVMESGKEFTVEPGFELMIPAEGTPEIRSFTLSDEEEEILRRLIGSTPVPPPTPAPTSTPTRPPTATPTQTPPPPPPLTPTPTCDPSYPDFCIPPPPPDLNCDSDVIGDRKNFTVYTPDPHNLDDDHDDIGCEEYVVP